MPGKCITPQLPAHPEARTITMPPYEGFWAQMVVTENASEDPKASHRGKLTAAQLTSQVRSIFSAMVTNQVATRATVNSPRHSVILRIFLSPRRLPNLREH